MRYKLLGRSGLRVSELALGAMTFSDRGLSWGASPEASRDIFEAFAQAGGTFIDTANIYGDVRGSGEGASERVLSDLISIDRSHFVVATKYTSSNTGDVSLSGNSIKSMRQSVDASLKALGTDYVDVLWLHAWDGTTPVEEVLRGATQLVDAGKVLYFAMSDTPAWVVSQACAMADTRGWTPPIAIQVEYSLAARTPERELLPMAEALDLGVTAWSPLAGGLLTGKYTDGSGVGQSRRLSDEQYMSVSQHSDESSSPRDLDEHQLGVVRAVSEVGCAPSQVALAWLRQRPGVVIPAIVGARAGADRAEPRESGRRTDRRAVAAPRDSERALASLPAELPRKRPSSRLQHVRPLQGPRQSPGALLRGVLRITCYAILDCQRARETENGKERGLGYRGGDSGCGRGARPGGDHASLLPDLLGWGPWRIYDLREPLHHDTSVRGEPVRYSMPQYVLIDPSRTIAGRGAAVGAQNPICARSWIRTSENVPCRQ